MNKILIAIVAAIAIFVGGLLTGISHEKGQVALQQQGANKVVIQKNATSQVTANKVESQQIVYRDRVVTQYKTIEKRIKDYASSKDNANSSCIDSNFISIYNNLTKNPNYDASAAK